MRPGRKKKMNPLCGCDMCIQEGLVVMRAAPGMMNRGRKRTEREIWLARLQRR